MVTRILIYLGVFVILISGITAAPVTFTGPTSVTAGSDDVDITCAYTLVVNETAQSVKMYAPSGVIFSWNNPADSSQPSPSAGWKAETVTPTSIQLKKEASKTDAGTYNCTVVSTSGSTGGSLSVQVRYKPEISVISEKSLGEGETLTVACSAVANPVASLSWYLGSTMFSSSGTLTISNIRRSQTGTYTCKATNAVGDDSKPLSVIVNYLDNPQMTITPNTVAEGGIVTINCSANSNPPANITVVKTVGSWSGSSPFTRSYSPTCLDAGPHQCSALNTQPSTTKTVTKTLTVLCKPRYDNRVSFQANFTKTLTEVVEFKATLVSYPEPRFTWMRTDDTGTTVIITNEPGHFRINNTDTTSYLEVTILSGDDYGKYTLKAVNNQGETTLEYFLRSQTPPFQVTSLAVANVTTDSLTVMWPSVFNGGAEHYYVIQYQPMGDRENGAWTEKSTRISDTGRKTMIYARISDIYPGRAYTVRVYSENTFGRSQYSNAINVTTSEIPSEISFGAGMGIGIVISVVVVAAVVGAFLLYRRFSPRRKENNSSANPGDAMYSSLGSQREHPTTYDDLENKPNPVYENIGSKDVNGGGGASSPDVYVNFNPKASVQNQNKTNAHKKKNKKKTKEANKFKESSPGQAYENTAFGGAPGEQPETNRAHGGSIYANT